MKTANTGKRTNVLGGGDFKEKAVAINQRILRAAAVFAVLVELFNMARVLLFTNAKLGTLNNRIYFSFYLVYFTLSAVFLIVDLGLKLSNDSRYRIYMITGSVVLLWHVCFNIYDIYRAGAVGNFTVITAMAIVFALLIMKPVYAFVNLAVSYLLFVVFLFANFSSGEVINFTITALLCGLLYFVRYRHLCGAVPGQADRRYAAGAFGSPAELPAVLRAV